MAAFEIASMHEQIRQSLCKENATQPATPSDALLPVDIWTAIKANLCPHPAADEKQSSGIPSSGLSSYDNSSEGGDDWDSSSGSDDAGAEIAEWMAQSCISDDYDDEQVHTKDDDDAGTDDDGLELSSLTDFPALSAPFTPHKPPAAAPAFNFGSDAAGGSLLLLPAELPALSLVASSFASPIWSSPPPPRQRCSPHLLPAADSSFKLMEKDGIFSSSSSSGSSSGRSSPRSPTSVLLGPSACPEGSPAALEFQSTKWRDILLKAEPQVAVAAVAAAEAVEAAEVAEEAVAAVAAAEAVEAAEVAEVAEEAVAAEVDEAAETERGEVEEVKTGSSEEEEEEEKVKQDDEDELLPEWELELLVPVRGGRGVGSAASDVMSLETLAAAAAEGFAAPAEGFAATAEERTKEEGEVAEEVGEKPAAAEDFSAGRGVGSTDEEVGEEEEAEEEESGLNLPDDLFDEFDAAFDGCCEEQSAPSALLEAPESAASSGEAIERSSGMSLGPFAAMMPHVSYWAHMPQPGPFCQPAPAHVMFANHGSFANPSAPLHGVAAGFCHALPQSHLAQSHSQRLRARGPRGMRHFVQVEMPPCEDDAGLYFDPSYSMEHDVCVPGGYMGHFEAVPAFNPSHFGNGVQTPSSGTGVFLPKAAQEE